MRGLDRLLAYLEAGNTGTLPPDWYPEGYVHEPEPEPEPPPPDNLIHVARIGTTLARPPAVFDLLLKLGCHPVQQADGRFVAHCPVCQRKGLHTPALKFYFQADGGFRFKCEVSGCTDKEMSKVLSTFSSEPPPPPLLSQ